MVKKISAACTKFDKKNTGYLSDVDVMSVLGYADVKCNQEKVSFEISFDQSETIPILLSTLSTFRYSQYALTCQETNMEK